MSHWYTIDGEPRHTMATKPGAKYPTRGTTITDARKLNLFPSVSGIIDGCSNEYTRFRELALCEACYEFRPMGGEDAGAYAKRILGMERDSEAATIGTEIHAAIEAHFRGEELPEFVTLYGGAEVFAESMIGPAIAAIEGTGMKVVATEEVTVNKKLGYAGTLDLALLSKTHYAIADFKSCKNLPKKKIDVHGIQLSSYLASRWGQQHELPIGLDATAFNVYISTSEVGQVKIVKWSAEELQECFTIFQKMLEIWQWRNNYKPKDK
jgi:hypothetical protein